MMAVTNNQLLNNMYEPSAYVSHLPDLTIRQKAMLDAAKNLGIQSGLYWASQAIDDQESALKNKLNMIYNFSSLMLNDYVVPPVITQENNLVNISDNVIRFGSQRYRIIKNAYFSTSAPNWRSYLYMDYPQPDVPDKSLLPQTKDEKKQWDDAVTKGWHLGIHQARVIFQSNLNELTQDYAGMVLFHQLLLQHMVSLPYVQKQNHGITGDKNNLVINDHSWQIKADPQFEKAFKLWAPLMKAKQQSEDTK